jgi:hypothetical protein
MSPEEVAAWGKRSRAASGVPEQIEDEAVIARLVVLSDVGHDDGGPVPPARRRDRRRPTAAKTPTAHSRARRKAAS